MTNTIFYTFSTIAQTLAGAFALLGAFVLYRLQSLRSDIERDSSEIVELYTVGMVASHHGFQLHDLLGWHREGKYQLIAELPPRVDVQLAQFGESTMSRTITMQMRLRRNLDQRNFLLKTFKKSLWLTVGVIFSSVLALIAAELIALSNIVCWFVLIGGLLGFGICLYSYRGLIQKAIE